jgi:hypothetical protein
MKLRAVNSGSRPSMELCLLRFGTSFCVQTGGELIKNLPKMGWLMEDFCPLNQALHGRPFACTNWGVPARAKQNL